jgi:hypothetical protein
MDTERQIELEITKKEARVSNRLLITAVSIIGALTVAFLSYGLSTLNETDGELKARVYINTQSISECKQEISAIKATMSEIRDVTKETKSLVLEHMQRNISK